MKHLLTVAIAKAKLHVFLNVHSAGLEVRGTVLPQLSEDNKKYFKVLNRRNVLEKKITFAYDRFHKESIKIYVL